MTDAAGPAEMIPWDELPDDRRLQLRIAFGHYLDTLPPTCSLESKIERFRHWLDQRGVSYRG